MGDLMSKWVAITLSAVATCALADPAHLIESTKDSAHDVHEVGMTAQARAIRQELLNRAEHSLISGDVDGARSAFEQAALQTHSATIELGILRTQMQAGDYRQALAFAAHTAGVHLDEVEGRVFYAWLLNLGGQTVVANQTLQIAQAAAPDNPTVKAARQHFQSGLLLADGALLSVPARLAPYATGSSVPQNARAVASALLLADGEHAIAPLAALSQADSIWLRNGLGQTVMASVDQQDESLGLALLTLRSPLPRPGSEVVASRDPFPGSPAFAIDYPIDTSARPAWPVLRAGFVGSTLAGNIRANKLGIDLPSISWRGGPVYDQNGRLIGLAQGLATATNSPASKANDLFVSMSVLRARFGERFGSIDPDKRPSAIGTDELYEHAMRTALQVIVAMP
jgi:hypothetical protein